MTLPFRRRHHDAESGHDRARQLWSIAMIEPIDEQDEAWLDDHLDGCAECRLERDAQLADQGLLRALRDQPIQPPRDLWARTAAAIERESGRQSRGARGLPVPSLVPARARVPLGVLSGVLVVLVVVAVSFAPNAGVPPVAVATPSAGISNPTELANASPMTVAAAPVTYLQVGPDGSVKIINANVDEVCPSEKSGCAPLQQETQASLNLGAPQSIAASPHNDQLVVAAGKDGSRPGSVIVVPVPTPIASTPPGASMSPVASASAVPPTPTMPPTAAPSTASPSGGPLGSAEPTPVPTPVGGRSIAEGVVLVGAARYSADGRWLAFSAAPIDGSTGPDLYIWNGTDPAATRVTSDHSTYFSSWLDDRILASRLIDPRLAPGATDPAGTSTPSDQPASAAPASTTAAGKTPAGTTPGSPTPGSSGPVASGSAGPIILELHPVSFLFDPATGATQDLPKPDVWLPTVDSSGRFVTYWAGTIAGGPGLGGDATGSGFANIQLGSGHLVLDGWVDPLDITGAGGSGGPGASEGAASTESPATATASPGASGEPAGPIGPAGTPIELAPGPIAAFDARFDPTGTRLAVWVADAADPTVGTLRLVVLDRAHGRLDPAASPLPAVRALKGVSIDRGRLAWVTPPGQDGNQSTVQVLAWSNDDFGQVETVPGAQLTIVH